jgi:hypothetical protein
MGDAVLRAIAAAGLLHVWSASTHAGQNRMPGLCGRRCCVIGEARERASAPAGFARRSSSTFAINRAGHTPGP